jgi:predicted ATP-binding protein involved in virulence
MHLLRVQVPDFRGLKNIDITFEKDFFPSIFPLGSLNGGGKSTLLQLIFVLLHCSVAQDKKPFLENLLKGFKIADGKDQRVLAIIDIWDGVKIVKLSFVCVRNDTSFEILPILKNANEGSNYSKLTFSMLTKIESIKNVIARTEEELRELKKFINEYLELTKPFSKSNREIEWKLTLAIMGTKKISQIGQKLGCDFSSIIDSSASLEEFILEVLKKSQSQLEQYYHEEQELNTSSQQVMKILEVAKLRYILSYATDDSENKNEVLLCNIDNLNINEAEFFLNRLSENIFLAAPASQVFLFLSRGTRNLLFKNSDINNYYSELDSAKSQLPSFFTYDFFLVDLLIESFEDARDRDFRKAIETGEYGNNYKTLKNDLNQMLVNKQINLDRDFGGVNFQLDKNGETIELYPEDLSHGELKRLSIYIWLKSRNIEDAIVLMDEVEIAFHPDWQYQIISDLKEWAPSNQYILATHSYALCEALTPAHVKEIEPKLIKPESNITNES